MPNTSTRILSTERSDESNALNTASGLSPRHRKKPSVGVISHKRKLSKARSKTRRTTATAELVKNDSQE